MLKILLQEAVERLASDVHITVGVPPVFRVNGSLVRTDHPLISVQDTVACVEEITSEEQRRRFLEQGELDFSFAIPGVSRFRVNLFRQRGSMGLAIRIVNERISTLDQLGFPEVLKTLARSARGNRIGKSIEETQYVKRDTIENKKRD